MSMEKRVFLAILLSLVVLVAYQTYVVPPQPPVPAAPAAGAAASAATGAATPAGTVPAAAAGEAAKPALPPVQALVSDAQARDIVVETNDVRAVFSSAGAVLTSWKLKGYKNSENEPLDLVPEALPEFYDAGQPNAPKLVPLPRPFTLSTDDPAVSARLAKALYRPSADGLSLGAESGTLAFEYQDASGLHAKKTFTFQPDHQAFIVTIDALVEVAGAAKPMVIAWGPALAPGYRKDGSSDSQPTAPLQYHDGNIERLGVKEAVARDGVFRYAGVGDHYFLSLLLGDVKGQPAAGRPARMEYQPITLRVPESDDVNFKKETKRSFVAYSVGVPGPATLAFFVGPKRFDVLKAIDPELTYAIDFGMFRIIVVPLLQALKWVYGWVGNYGWAIITLTVLMNLLIFPLRHRSMVSMRKMQALQPEIKAIQERYKKYKLTDPERQKANDETMALYKAKGVNPASGCVPMLLTFPILFAFYSLLSCSIELRGAPFIFWITDLSLRDRYFITPIIMGATMFWQQRMMPSPGADPMQQKIFMFMPLIFTYTFLWAPSGLAIYWFSSNLLAIGQQFLTNRMIGGPTPAAGAAIARAKPGPAKKP
jgi:YidC/Oxa1 family membrane protein insertase